MTDRELLELAARAAGAEYEIDKRTGQIEVFSEIGGWSGIWNPLTDDGDALRLAVKLGITVIHAGATHVCEAEGGGYLADEVDPEGDGLSATRRAITRAAAEIGRTK